MAARTSSIIFIIGFKGLPDTTTRLTEIVRVSLLIFCEAWRFHSARIAPFFVIVGLVVSKSIHGVKVCHGANG